MQHKKEDKNQQNTVAAAVIIAMAERELTIVYKQFINTTFAPAHWLRIIGHWKRRMYQARTRNFKIFLVTDGTHTKIKIICFYCGSVFYFMLLFLVHFTNFQLFRILCFVSFLNVIGIQWNSQFFQSTLTLITFCVLYVEKGCCVFSPFGICGFQFHRFFLNRWFMYPNSHDH